MLNSTTKNLAMALVVGSLLAGTMATPSYAYGGGGGGEGPEVRQTCHTANCKHVNKKQIKKVRKAKNKKARKKGRAWAQSHDPATGRRITSIGNGDGTRTVIGTGIGFGPFGIQIWTSP